ncbi:kinase-like domain-containing protein [Cubamyces lactineus]|nr:kinase-like domain-containing protein [Cubamyces lactineus]
MSGTKALPNYVYLPPAAAQYYADVTRKGGYGLLPFELEWRDRQKQLIERGYLLRPRYSKDWKPSWIGTNIHPRSCEDSIILLNYHVIDATRNSDGMRVAIKIVVRESEELHIAEYLASVRGEEHHCVTALDVLPDPINARHSLLVMPYLRPFNNPEFQLVGDVVDFVGQMLDGLAFLHKHRIAHRDIAAANVMMDATPIYPDGYHPVRLHRAPDAIHDANPLSRMDHPVKYFYVDYGLSVRFQEGAVPLVRGKVGRDTDIPEMSSEEPYDAFKADIYALGNLFDKEIAQHFDNVKFLLPLIELIKQHDPDLRPPPDELVKMFKQMRALLQESDLRRRLVPTSEPAYERLFNDTVAVAREGFNNLRRMVGQS